MILSRCNCIDKKNGITFFNIVTHFQSAVKQQKPHPSGCGFLLLILKSEFPCFVGKICCECSQRLRS